MICGKNVVFFEAFMLLTASLALILEQVYFLRKNSDGDFELYIASTPQFCSVTQWFSISAVNFEWYFSIETNTCRVFSILCLQKKTTIEGIFHPLCFYAKLPHFIHQIRFLRTINNPLWNSILSILLLIVGSVSLQGRLHMNNVWFFIQTSF